MCFFEAASAAFFTASSLPDAFLAVSSATAALDEFFLLRSSLARSAFLWFSSRRFAPRFFLSPSFFFFPSAFFFFSSFLFLASAFLCFSSFFFLNAFFFLSSLLLFAFLLLSSLFFAAAFSKTCPM